MNDVVGIVEDKNTTAPKNYTKTEDDSSDSDSDWYDPFDWVQ